MNRRVKKQVNMMGIASLACVAVIFAVLLFGTWQVSGSSSEEGVQALQQAVERAAVLCYATEGFYPPSLDYIVEHYGLQLNSDQYIVVYQVFATNIHPTIQVFAVGAA